MTRWSSTIRTTSASVRLGQALRARLNPDWVVREEKSIVLGRHWRPEPDIAVAQAPHDRYRARAPRRADLAAVVEVSDSTYAKDRGIKWVKYAASGIAVYWIVNLPLRQIEVYGAPQGRGNSAAYRDVKIYGSEDDVPVNLEGRFLGQLKVSDVLA